MIQDRTLTTFEILMHNSLIYSASSCQGLQRLILIKLSSVLSSNQMTPEQKEEASKLLIDSVSNLSAVSRLFLNAAKLK